MHEIPTTDQSMARKEGSMEHSMALLAGMGTSQPIMSVHRALAEYALAERALAEYALN